MYLAAGTDPYELVDKAVAAAAKLSGTSKARQDKALPEVVDVFGWCTWDAYYSKVSARGEAAVPLLMGCHQVSAAEVRWQWPSHGLPSDTCSRGEVAVALSWVASRYLLAFRSRLLLSWKRFVESGQGGRTDTGSSWGLSRESPGWCTSKACCSKVSAWRGA